MESIEKHNEGIQRQITELKEAVAKLNANQFSLLEMCQQDKHIGKDLQEKFDIMSENIDDLRTTVCHIGELAEKANEKAEEGFNEFSAIRQEVNQFKTHTNNKLVDMQSTVNHTKLSVDRNTDSFGTLLSKSNQSLDCIKILQNRISKIESDILEHKQHLAVALERLDALKHKQKNITLVIK